MAENDKVSLWSIGFFRGLFGFVIGFLIGVFFVTTVRLILGLEPWNPDTFGFT